MLPSKVMPYLPRLAAPLMDSSIVQITTSKGKDFINIFLITEDTSNIILPCFSLKLEHNGLG